MIKPFHHNKQIIIKKLQNFINNNKSSLKSNRTGISNGIKNSFDNNIYCNINFILKILL